jgi:tetratricopeptide (TPR) repeat protein
MQRLHTLLQFLEQDPKNLNLLADAADAAFGAGQAEAALELLDRYAALSALTLPLLNLRGLSALRAQRVDDAAEAFDALIAAGVDDPAVRFNRAWVYALHEEHRAALDLLDDDAVSVTERGASLKVQMLHHLGRIEDALAAGEALVERFPENDGLLGALSVAAMDNDDMDLARHYAGTAKGGADAFTTQGLIALNDGDAADSLVLFDSALAENPRAPRALIGKGLGLLAQGDIKSGTAALREGAEIFGDHLGSWIALGWTQFIARDLAAARATFEHAYTLDDNFAETHGGLAVLDIAEGKLDSAQRRTDTALRLDRECFGGMLARVLLAEAKGSADVAQKLWEKAITVPAGANGQTLAQAMVGMGLNAATMRPSKGGGSNT